MVAPGVAVQPWATETVLSPLVGLPSRLGLYNTLTTSLQRGKTPHLNECPGYDTKQSDGEVPAVLEL